MAPVLSAREGRRFTDQAKKAVGQGLFRRSHEQRIIALPGQSRNVLVT